MNTNLISAIKQIAAERGIEVEEILDGIKQAIRLAFKRDYPEDEGAALEVEIDPEEDTIAVYADKKVVTEVTNPPTQISLDDAQKIQPKLKVGDHVLVEITHTGDFGRVAAQAARQVILQKLKESEHEAMVKQFKDKIGTVDSAVIQRMDRDNSVICEIYRAIARMPREEQIPTEFYQSGSRIKVYLKKIEQDAKGKTLIVSRSDPNFLRALFEMEVPEIASGTVEIMEIAREAGSRSKVAVRSNADGVDPIGSCVGQRGSRINSITNELKTTRGEEKIDIIPWNEDTKTFLANAIRPAEAAEVKIINEEERQALILVDDEYLSLAIGREGQNVRLAVKLTGWKLDIQGVQGYKEAGEISKFQEGEKPAKAAKKEEKTTKTSEIDSLGLTSRTVSALGKAGVTGVSDLKAKVEAGEKIAGVGPKSMEEIKAALG
ncbi:transcription termination/antitermination protein NusA [Candidatus Dojkabacteria bacterium]|uniref:Transcription termination/antitermination protein NusA n=1 Tax=Candidatus Dojkabacteria bacterium TaxID=2099670 RepID=A0A955L075_9BACT|nr:transcription termination/antitermination protein NusA [Candidatus Dojkabacteria bacterium]